MAEPEALQFSLTISASHKSNEELDYLTRQLLKELRELEIESARLVSGDTTPAGAKGLESVTVGAIAIAVLPTMLPKVLEFLQSWSLQGKGRTIKFKGKVASQQIEFEGSFDEMQKLVELLEKKQKKQKK
jgi:hypothetical protein